MHSYQEAQSNIFIIYQIYYYFHQEKLYLKYTMSYLLVQFTFICICFIKQYLF